MLELGIRFDMRYPNWVSAERADLYRWAADEMAQFADAVGFHVLLIGEHHGTDDGYTSAPFVAAASFSARTASLRVRMRAVLLALHDPVDLAEQLLTLDVLTAGLSHLRSRSASSARPALAPITTVFLDKASLRI